MIGGSEAAGETTARFHADESFRRLFHASPAPLLVLAADSPRFTIVEVNDAYLAATMRTRAGLIGRALFEAFPDNPDDATVAGVSNLRASLERVLATRRPDTLPDLQYDIARPDGTFEQRWWSPVNSPVLDDSGEVEIIIHNANDVTAQHRAEASLAESEARFRNMADHAPVMMWVTDASGYCTYLNRAWYEFTGQTREEAEGFGWLDATHPDDKAAAERAFHKANSARGAFRVEYRLRGADGTYRWSIDAASPRFGPAGEFLGYIGTVIDIHERHEAEQRLRASEARFRAAVDAVQGIIWTNNATGQMIGEQLGWASLTGQSFEDYQGYGWSTAVHPDDAQPTVDAWNAAVAARGVFDFEHRVRRHDGAWRRYSVRAIPIVDSVGAVSEWVGIHTDVTDRREMEFALAASEARYRTLFESIESGFCVVEVDLEAPGERVDYRVVEANPAFFRQTGFPETILGRWLREAAPALEEHWYEIYGRVARTGVAERFERGSDALGRWFDVYAFRTGEPADRRVALLFNDISVRREAEQRLRDSEAQQRKLNETLEDRVAERTAALTQAHDQLRQSQKLEAMGQLTGGVAHDFNNLLTPIVGSLDMLQRKGVGGEREQRLIEGALQSADRAATLVQRLLAFARRQPLQAGPVDVARLTQGMADLVVSTTGPNIKVVVDAPTDLPAATADPNQLEMAILNLAVNARDAMPEGGTLTISVVAETLEPGHRARIEPGRYLCISVADTGKGMDPATLARAVEPFFSTKGVGKGTGLGLSMAHGLAAQLGGGLHIASRPGLGTKVELWLPASSETAPAAAPVGVAEAKPASGTALLVDDEDVVRASTADMLADLGYQVVEADSAEAALRLVDAGQDFDVLVTDHLMAGMSGAELARELKSRQPGIQVLLVSGYADVDDVAPDLSRLVKPFRQADLAAKLAELAA